MPPELIIALRHGEKPANAEDDAQEVDEAGPGFDEEGRENPSSLTLRGWQRSGALAGTALCGLLAQRAGVTFAVPSYGHTDQHRSYQTVHALARRFGEKPKPWTSADEVDELLTRALACDGTLVLCWEHDALAQFARKLSHAAPADWPHGRFDVLWVFERSDDAYGFKQIAQDLLPGDHA